ncbi:MAG: carboxypeptidase-like regulatory domain-containing protein [Bacteroidia bacterium]
MHKYIYILLLLGFAQGAYAQNSAEIKGTIRDSLSGELLLGANVILLQNGTMITGTKTDMEGEYYLSGIAPGNYILKVSYTGYGSQERLIQAKGGQSNKVDIKLGMVAIVIELPDDIYGKRPNDTVVKIDIVGPPPLSREILMELPTNTIEGRLISQAGTTIRGNQISIKGARPSATGFYLGTMPLITRLNFSSYSLAQFGVVLGGVSPEYGDFVGGAVVQSLVPVNPRPYFSAEVISSSLFDKFHYSQVDVNFGGPLITKHVKSADYNRMVLGYHMNLNLIYQHDPKPSAVGVWKVKDASLKAIEERPITPASSGSGYVPTAEFLTFADLEKVQARDNADESDLMWLGKLEFRPLTNLSIEVAAIVDRRSDKIAPFGNQLLNSASNPLSTNWSVISYLNLEHNLLAKLSENKIKSNQLRRMKYSISLQYQGVWNRTEDQELKDDYFRYGYVGQYNAYRAPVYHYTGEEGPAGRSIPVVQNGDTVWVKNYYELQGFSDTLITFDRSRTANPLLANYSSTYFDLAGPVRSFGQLNSDGGAVLNGNNPIGIYSNMWNNTGALIVGSSINSGVGRSQTEQFSMSVQGELAKGIHTAKIGVYFEQRVSRAYSVNAMNLWSLMFQSANEGLQLDRSNPILHYDKNGQFMDSVSYREVFNDNQSGFSKRLREALMAKGYRDVYGNPITPESYVNVHGLNPDDLSLELFTADELLGSGGNNQYVSYFGYDHLGRKSRKNPSVSDFLSDPENRSIGAFRPIYAAMYLQDVIEIRDLIIRLGVRIERFDANVPVLKDPYSLYPIRQAGEVTELNGQTVSHPAGVGNDFLVYVDDIKNPKAIVGYRKGNRWYNEDGLVINDPGQLTQKTKSGLIQPYLVDQKEELTANSFKDFEAKVMVLPRFSVDFPISTEARFFAYYDVLAQRPSNIFTPIDEYAFLRFNPTKVLNNPDLKPQITTDYEIGFRQLISRSSSLSLTASYREQRNMIQLVRYYQAYPVSYISYGNIDLSTIKGFRTEYLLQRKHFTLNSSYTYQIAEGTGSGTGSQGGLVSAGQPNLRNLFPLSFDIRHNIKLTFIQNFGQGKNYQGPVIGNRRILENAGISLTLNAFSGQPFTATTIATPDAQSGIASRSPLKGTPNGSRTPWSFNNNLNLYRGFPVVLGKRDGKDIEGVFTVTLWMENFLNIRNIEAVHAYSGSAETDGYLNSANGKSAIEAATNSQSFVDLYNTALANPGYYGLPRRTRLSLQLTF